MKKYDLFDYKNIFKNIYDFKKDNKNFNFSYKNYSVNRLDLRIFLENFTPFQKKFFLSEIHHLQFLSVYCNDGIAAQLGFVLLKDQEHSVRIISLMEKMFHNILKAYNCQDIRPWGNMRVVKEFNNLLEVAKHTSGIQTIKTENHKTRGVKQTQTLVAKDDMIVTYIEGGMFDLFSYDIEKIATTIFARYQKAKRK